jgi:UTP-glucose-1-phosphate uridylyltransferase
MRKPLRKAIFPVGGLGTRFLPATKAMPKEMLPVAGRYGTTTAIMGPRPLEKGTSNA